MRLRLPHAWPEQPHAGRNLPSSQDQRLAAKKELEIRGFRANNGIASCRFEARAENGALLKRTMRRPRRAGDKRGQIVDLVSISKRPATVEDRAVPGHWEGDLLSGSKNSYIATLVERQTRYVTLAKVANKDTQTVVSALIKQAKTIPNELYKSLTWDRGKELADHRCLTLATNIDVYFCDPQSPWQRGSNENTNGLLRQYLPKGTDLSVYSQAQLNKVARQLNERPRKTLAPPTPLPSGLHARGVELDPVLHSIRTAVSASR